MENGDKDDVSNVETENPEIGNKQPLKIDFESVFASDRNEPVAELVVVPSGATDDDRRRRKAAKRKASAAHSSSSSFSSPYAGDDLSMISESELHSRIERTAVTVANYGDKLPDKGAKLKDQVQRLEEELERRRLRRSQEDDNGHKNSAHSISASSNGVSGGHNQSEPSSQALEQSQFAACLMKKLKDDDVESNSESNTGDELSKASNHELSHFNRCDKRKKKSAGRLQQSKRLKSVLSFKGFSAWKPRNGSCDGEKCMPLNGKLPGRASSTGSLLLLKEKLADPFPEKDASHVPGSDGLNNEKGQTVVLVDEDEPELVERMAQAKELPSSTDEAKIYYPSREDPESLEIFRSELKCLEPGECLTSTIMNFYIRFLQESSTERLRHKLYFFNTYFYSKLQKAIAYQKDDKEAFFMKFRRWWRGVNIFEKAYIFLPINEDKHWSLVIICIPQGEDKSGPIILHLDSLGLHCSQSIFDNIRSLLKNEGNFLSEDGGALDISTSDRKWRLLHRIDAKIITVPRQTNDYDCGLFVLYYMERFIEEAPVRLTRENLSMFGKHWFKPQEASRLRGKIKKILQDEFHRALKENDCMWQPVCLSANAKALS